MTPRSILRPAAFAIPGDINTVTGGYIYERRLLEGLREAGRVVEHIQIGSTFPDPTPEDMADAAAKLAALPADCPLILDGLVFGSIETAALAAMRAPIVAMVHHPLAFEKGLDAARRDHLYRTERDNLAQTAHVLVPSPHTANLLMSDYDVETHRITIARPGTDRPTRQSKPVGPPMILSVGIQHPRKGHDVLLHALAELMHLAPGLEWQAVIVGSRYDAAHAQELDNLRARLGLNDRVRMAGRVSDEELAQLYAQATLFALATRYEGYGIVFDEAMAHGLPIISCRTGAVPDTVAKDAGLLVDPDNPKAFAGALEQVLSHPKRRKAMAMAAQKAGAILPAWSDTARIAGEVLDALSVQTGA